MRLESIHILPLGDQVVYVYPDFKTTLVGLFVNDTMISARAGKIVAHRCKDGMMEIDVSRPKKDAPSVSYFKATNIRINDKVILADTELFTRCKVSIFSPRFRILLNEGTCSSR